MGVHSILGCVCNGRKDTHLGLGGKCTNGPDGQWCYVNQDSGCEDLSEYHWKWVSHLPCIADYFHDDTEDNPDFDEKFPELMNDLAFGEC